jgi:hypothetical protein
MDKYPELKRLCSQVKHGTLCQPSLAGKSGKMIRAKAKLKVIPLYLIYF